MHTQRSCCGCRARAAAPAIIFFDEIDGLATNRAQAEGGGGASLEARVLATLLSEMDGLQVICPACLAVHQWESREGLECNASCVPTTKNADIHAF